MDRRAHRGAPFLGGSALVWHRDGITYRLEGDLSLDEALALTRSLD
jgi:ABC-type transporter Mla MlaB component